MHPSFRFYDALPKHKAELVDGKLYVGGSLRKSAMALGFMVERLGRAYVEDICPKGLLENALIEVYGRPGAGKEPLADFEPVDIPYNRPQKLATDLRLSLFDKPGLFVSGGSTAIKLGADAFMPDVYLLKPEKMDRLTDYYFDGAPDLIMEVSHPYMREFDYGLRMERYAAAGVPEVWMLDYEKRTFEPFVLADGAYQLQHTSEAWYVSRSIPELRVQHERFYDTAASPGLQISDIFDLSLPPSESGKIRFRKGYGYGDLPFAPRLDLDPVPISVQEYFSWGGEVKFELVDGKPLFGGGYETTREWLGLLLMTLGVKEAVKYFS
jgi:Uma2 family endonuclease